MSHILNQSKKIQQKQNEHDDISPTSKFKKPPKQEEDDKMI